MFRSLIILLLMAVTLSIPAQTNRNATKKKAGTTAVSKKKQTSNKRTVSKKTTVKKSTGKKTTTKKKTVASKKQTTPQKPKTISGLRDEQAEVKRKIAAERKRLSENERNVQDRLRKLMVINNGISDKRKVIDSTQADIRTLDTQIGKLSRQLEQLKSELEINEDRYVTSLRYMHRNRSMQNQLMFIFSAENFSQMYRRMRFMREYATYQRLQGERVKAKQREVGSKRAELRKARGKMKTLLGKVETEERNLKSQQKEQQRMVTSLQRQQKTIHNVIAQQQKRNEEINEEIDRLVAIEIERARREAAEEAERERKRELASQSNKSSHSKKEDKKETAAPRPKTQTPLFTAADYKLSGSFENNKGRLPIPVTGGYRIAGRFGNYNVEGLRGVRLNNKGINILAQPGARVRSVFDGVVSAIFAVPRTLQYGVILRHGSYVTVYWPIVGVKVKKGERVKARQTIGTLGGDNVLEFQLRKEKTKLNPEPWLGR